MKHRFRKALGLGALAVWILTVPATAIAQTDIPPPIVQNLDDPNDSNPYNPWLGAAAGATVVMVGVNAWTGGTLLAPVVGVNLSNLLGGAWLGPAAMPPLSAQSLFETTTLLASGLVGGGMGYWLAAK